MKKHIVSIIAVCNKSKIAKYQYTGENLYIFSAWSVYRLGKDEIGENELREKGFTGFYSNGMTSDYEQMKSNDPRLLKKPLECVHIPKKEISERRTYITGKKYIGIDFSLLKPFEKRIASIYAPRMNTGKAPCMCFDENGEFLCAVMPYMVNQDECKKRFGDGITYLHGKESA